MQTLCPWESAQYFIFSSNVPTLLYYSHFVAILAALIFGLALFSQRKESLSIKLFLFGIAAFIGWTALDVPLWASNRPDFVMFSWGSQVLLEIFIYSSAFYFAYTFIKKKDLGFVWKLAIAALMAPVIFLLPTSQILPGIDVSTCNAVESAFLIYYVYGYEVLLSLSILFLAFREMALSRERRKEVGLFTFGILVYLLAFSSGNIIGSLTEDWALAQIGLFGMPIFIALLAYTVIKFRTFNLKLISAQALVTAIWLLTLAILFIRKIENVRIVVAFTLALFTILGYQLIKSVKKEISARELIEKQKAELEKANARLQELDRQKTEFVSFATHQLRSPLTAIKGNASLVLEGDAGPVSGPLKSIVETIYASVKTMINVVEDYLNISRIELGTMKYDMRDLDFKDFLSEIVSEQKPNIEAKGLAHSVSFDASEAYKIKADPDKFKQVVMNTIDNSIKYTPRGSIAVSLEKGSSKAPERAGSPIAGNVIRLKISDTGVGIRQDVMPKLFQKFSRAPNASEANIHGTGLGLFIAKSIMEAHGGRVWAESEGEGKGSQFYVELPEAN